MSKFIGVDGEGLTRDDGSHDYVLLAASDDSFIDDWSIGGISTSKCFNYLLELSRNNPKSKLVGFRFSYDVNMMLRDVPRSILEKLHERNSVDWVAERGVKWFIEYVPNKWLTVTKSVWQKEGDKGWWKRNGTAKVWDVFGFYQMSFLRAIEEWKTSDTSENEFIARMKLARGVFTEAERLEIARYCALECRLLSRLVEQLDDALIEAELPINQYHGAGAIANELFKIYGAKDYIIRRPENEHVWDAIMHSYFGGRIESFVAGYVPEAVYDYDVNSAYPAAIRDLPNMRDGVWIRVGKWDSAYEYGIWHVRWNTDSNVTPFPLRYDGNIYYTQQGQGWYHAVEVRAAMECGFDIQIIEGLIFSPHTDEKPFKWVGDIYEQRRYYKSIGDKREKALKLGLNSLYGKFAQGVSRHDAPGRFQCYFFAGYITASCRAKILRAGMQCPQSLIAFATDGILSTSPLDLVLDKSLGGWEAKEPITNGIMVVQPGFIIGKAETIVRTRGVDKSSVGYQRFYDAWQAEGIAAKCATIDTRFLTLGTALQGTHNTAELKKKWRRWKANEIHIGFFPSRKVPPMDAAQWNPETYVKLSPIWPFDDVDFLPMSERYKEQVIVDDGEPMAFIDFLDTLYYANQ